MNRMRFEFWIDRGGTFTDCILLDRTTGDRRVTKVLSSDRAPLVGIRQLLDLGADAVIPPSDIRMGTTVATNALLERKGRRTGLLITRGFRDALSIADQTRPDLFQLDIKKPELLYQAVSEWDARLSPSGEELARPSPEQLQVLARELASQKLQSLAVVVLHAYANRAFEAELAQQLLHHWPVGEPVPSLYLSAELCPEQGLLARTSTTVLGAYVGPLLQQYLAELSAALPGSRLRLMQSAGGLASPAQFFGTQAILSGPAGGVVAAAYIAEQVGSKRLLTLDMGGTSTDVALIQGSPELTHEKTIDGVQLRTPLLNIHTVAAGGGSVCRFDGYKLQVGPDSVGATPGPLCYPRAGEAVADAAQLGELSITDINLALGRVVDDYFPFSLDAAAPRLALQREAQRMNPGSSLSIEELAAEFSTLVSSHMAEALRTATLARGIVAKDCDLLIFGGAAGQHACAVARYLGIRKVYAHRLSGVLSAYGIGQSDVLWHGDRDGGRRALEQEHLAFFEETLNELVRSGRAHLKHEEALQDDSVLLAQRELQLRYVGTESTIGVSFASLEQMRSEFEKEHAQRFGFTRPDAAIEVTSCRVLVRLPGARKDESNVAKRFESSSFVTPTQSRSCEVYLDAAGWQAIPVYEWQHLHSPAHLIGPALLLDDTSTYFIESGFEARVLEQLLCISPSEAAQPAVLSRAASAAQIPLFALRFGAISSQMGEALRRSASSTNIRDRLDYSCAIFDPQGHLVANAPHIPVHLGAMSETVRCVLRLHPQLKPGDSIVSNSPQLGGSHLPDITVVTPVFSADGQLQCITASRGHHADIGGITPGSMPAFSHSIAEEGVELRALPLVTQGAFQEQSLREALLDSPYPARKSEENLADLRAQLAANQLGQRLLLEFIEELGDATHAAAQHGAAQHGAAQHGAAQHGATQHGATQHGAAAHGAAAHEAAARGATEFQRGLSEVRQLSAQWTRDTIARLPDGERQFEDFLDTGQCIRLAVRVHGDELTLDFSGTSAESDSNLNAPYAVTLACVLYVLRTLINQPLPLNDGCLEPVRLIVPKGSILNPSPGRAVASGNVETSQRVVDVLLAALDLAAASQGTMNNLSFGDDSFGYYETIAGGAGAGPYFEGAHAVHTHMTNTRITDAEVLEGRFPVRLVEFCVREASGGAGAHSGGNGVRRTMQALRDLDFSIISERRNRAPFGLHGGLAGAPGRNLLDGKELAGRASGRWKEGSLLSLETPGGGGWGTPGNRPSD